MPVNVWLAALQTVKHVVLLILAKSVIMDSIFILINVLPAMSLLVFHVLQAKLVLNVLLDSFWSLHNHANLVIILAKHAEHLTSNASLANSPSK